MTPEIASNALVFLSRTEIKGSEAPAFMQVVDAMQLIAEPEQAPSAHRGNSATDVTRLNA